VQEALQAADERAWAAFTRKFRREMSEPDRSRELALLAALSHQTNLSLGCYCETRAAATGRCCGNCWLSAARRWSEAGPASPELHPPVPAPPTMLAFYQKCDLLLC